MANQKVLIVDDSKAIRMQVREMLPKGSFEVLEAADGMEGLEVINREALSLILIDFFMPRMNGWEVVQKLSDHPKFKNIPCSDDVWTARRCGASRPRSVQLL